jgi:hypothetical protein
VTVEVTLPRARPVRPAEGPGGPARPRRRAWSGARPGPERLEMTGYTVGFGALYLAVGAVMNARNIVFADALSRVGNAFYVLYSRDPHLPAVGFVWNPLPSLALLPILPFKAFAPSLVSHGFAGTIESACCMAGTVALMASCLRRLGVRLVPRSLLTLLFGLQPMIILYAGSGLSEPMMLLFLLLTVRALLGWLADRRAGQLVSAGFGLGLGYLTRYEAIGPTVVAVVLVAVVSARSARGARRARLGIAANDALLVAAPPLFAFALWAVMSRVLVGEWLATFTSTYGNSAQVTSGRSSIRLVAGKDLSGAVWYAARQIFGLAPGLAVLLVAVAVLAVRQRRIMPLAGPLVVGAVLAFDDLTFLRGQSFGWLRFQITAIPLTVLLAGALVAALPRPRSGTAQAGRVRPAPLARVIQACRPRRAVALVGATVVIVIVGTALPTQARVLTTVDNGLAREEAPMLRSTFHPATAGNEEKRSLLIFQTEREIAGYVDGLDLGESTVLTDAAYAYPVVLSSERPRVFVITSDRDFKAAVADPAGHGIRYLLVPAPDLGAADALRRQWPDLYENGDRIATLVRQWNGLYYGNWRLYRVR